VGIGGADVVGDSALLDIRAYKTNVLAVALVWQETEQTINGEMRSRRIA
jgi:hypothetical protein